jgi:hypothetical protein
MIVILALAVMALAGPTFAQQKTDYSGTWKLNVDKSDFGPVPGPSSETEVIEQSADSIKIHVHSQTEEGVQQFTMTLVPDGKEVAVPADTPLAHPVPEATLESMTASWDGPVLVVNEKLTYGGDPVVGVARYTLSPDKKVLTVGSDYTSQAGDATRTFVFDKVDAAAPSAAGTSATPSASSAAPASAASTSSSAASSSHPNLSGTWVLDVSKSDFGQMPAPESRTDTIENDDASFKVTMNSTGGPMGDRSITMTALTDGKTVSNWSVAGNDAKSTAHWEGDTLVVHTDVAVQDNPVSVTTRYTLAPDGKTLNAEGHVSGPMGEGTTKLVFNKR